MRTSANRVKLININARSIVNKSVELEAILLCYNPHIVVITETWLRDDIDDTDVFPPSYQVFRRDRPTRGGGVAVLIKCGIRASLVRQIDNHESVTLKAFCSGRTFLLSAVYRPPDATSQFLHDLCDHLRSFSSNEVIIAGDFNLPSVDWHYPFSNTGRCTDVGPLLDIMLNLDVQQVVTEPTRVCDASSSILDVVFCC